MEYGEPNNSYRNVAWYVRPRVLQLDARQKNGFKSSRIINWLYNNIIVARCLGLAQMQVRILSGRPLDE